MQVDRQVAALNDAGLTVAVDHALYGAARCETPLAEFMEAISPGDPHSWDAEMAWIKDHHLQRLADLTFSIATFGIRVPILVGTDFRCWDGHHRVTAAYDLGLETIPVTLASDSPYGEE